MAIDRSKFKATSVAAVQQQDKEVTSLTGKKGDRAGYLKLKPGKNLHRIMPAHPDGGGSSFIEPKSTVWLPMMVEERDDKGQVVKGADGQPLMKEGSKSVFNSRIHGNTEKDLVEQFFNIGNAWADKHKFDADPKRDTDARKKFKDKLWGNYKANIQGIRYNHNWVYYAKDLMSSNQPFGLCEVKPSVKDGINKIINMEASNQPIGTEATDPFTDVEEGRALVINYDDKAEKANDYYTTTIDTATEDADLGGRKVKIQKVYPLTDDDLTQLEKFPSLFKTFRNCFKKKDFKLQYEGLQFFDKKNGMGIFNSPEFQAVIEEIAAYFPEEEVDDTVPDDHHEDGSVTTTTDGGTASEESTEETGDEFDLMNRDELKAFAKANKTGILVKADMTEETLRERVREWKAAMEADDEEEPAEEAATETTDTAEEKKEEQKEEAKIEVPAGGETAAQRKLREMKERNKAKQ